MARERAMAAMLLSLAASAGAHDTSTQRESPGWVFGGGVTAGQLQFSNAEGRGVAVGPVTGAVVLPYGGDVVEQRAGQVIDLSIPPPPETVKVARFPRAQTGAALTLHGGYAFSPRLAVLAEFEVMASYNDGFNHLIVAAVVRYSPASRLWVEAGPARGDLAYGYEGGATAGGSITGDGFAAAAGITVVKRDKWTLDVQARYGRIWYDGFEASNVSFGLSAGRVRSGSRTGH